MINYSKLAVLAALMSAVPLLTTAVQAAEPAGTPGKISKEVWWNMSIHAPLEYAWKQDAFYQTADLQADLNSLEASQNIGDLYVQRLRGYIIAPVTGEYQFWASGNENFAVWLGDNDSKFSKKKILHYKRWSDFREWGKDRDQESAPVNLVAGQRYYIEAQNKEGVGNDHLSVSWAYTDGAGLVNWAADNAAVATQSTEANGGSAVRAIDGNISGESVDQSIAYTLDQAGSWWQVDLGQSRLIDRVKLFNINALWLQPDLSNFRVSILNGSGAVVLSQDFHTNGGHVKGTEMWETGGVQGNVVRIEILGVGTGGKQSLTLAEVQVQGRSNSSAMYQARQLIPSTVVESYAGSLNDLDGDELPDDWETQYGFNTSSSQVGDYAAYADPDKDLITNEEEARLGLDPFTSNSLPNLLSMERWYGIRKSNVEELIKSDEYFGEPQTEELVAKTQFKDIADFSGARIRGYITAPVSGNYRFWISSKNGSELWLSEDVTKYKKKRIARMGALVGTGHGIRPLDSDLWDRFSSQMSEEVYLVAGQKYYMEILTQQSSYSEHLSVAWAVPNQPREALPLNVVSSYAFDAGDLDDDYLPDSWETQYGLSATDNGGIDRLREGENGDYDGDGLNNLAEYLAGTDPANPDTDGDSVSDGDEVQSYGSDPTVSDALSDVLIDSLNLATYRSSDSSWDIGREGLISNSFRGSLEWDFSVPTAGNWNLRLLTLLRGSSLEFNERVPVEILIDGMSVWSGELVYGLNYKSDMRVLTPYLAVGQHQVKIVVNNIYSRRNVAIEAIEVLKPDGVDADNDGQPDWVESHLLSANYVTSYSPTSRVSPAFLEGNATVRTLAQVNGIDATPGLDSNHWYADFTLDPNQATSFNVDFDQGVSESGAITWQSTNVFDNETLNIRRGDSLKLIAQPNGTSTGQSVSLNFGENDWTRIPGVTATQSSTVFFGAPERAIDANFDPFWSGYSITFTQNVQGSWWQVDLGETRTIDRVKLWNRAEIPEHLSNYRISILDTNGNTVISKDFHTTSGHSGATETWTLNAPVQGKVVKITNLGLNRRGRYFISFAECQVFGSDVVNLASDSDYATYSFTTDGAHTVTATHSNGNTAQLNVNVKKADFSATPKDLINNLNVNVKLDASQVDHDLHFEGGKSANVLSSELNGADLLLRIAPKSSGVTNIAARLYENGPILGIQPVNVIVIADALQNDLLSNEVSEDFANYRLLTSPLVTANLPAGGKVKVTIFRAGVMFTDGSTVKWLNVDDLVNGVYYLEFLFPEGISGSFCHHLDFYDRNGVRIGRR